MLKIIVDAMGGDNAPAEIVKGALDAVKERPDFKVVLTGDEALVNHELEKYTYDASRVEVVACTQVITNDDVPTQAVRAKRDSSLVVGLNMLKNDPEAGGFVSAGSTGAVLTGGIMFVGRLKGVMRPALCPGIPNVRGEITLLRERRVQARLSGAVRRHGVRVRQSRVRRERAARRASDQRHRIMYGDVDVVVSDGFSGNVALKAIEGCGKTVASMLKKEFTRSLGSKISYLFARKPVKGLARALDYSRFGGSVFLGLKKVVIKSHGSSKAFSVKQSVFQAIDAYRGGLIPTLEQMFSAESEAE